MAKRRRNPTKTYKTEASFRKALAKFKASGELVDWYGTDHGWVIRTKKIVKGNPKRDTTVPAHVRINPRNGRIQVFVTPKVAEKLRGGKGLRVAGNPGLAPPQGGASRIPVKLKYAVIDSTGKSHSATTKSHAKTLQKVLKVRGLTSKVVTLPKGSTTWNT